MERVERRGEVAKKKNGEVDFWGDDFICGVNACLIAELDAYPMKKTSDFERQGE